MVTEYVSAETGCQYLRKYKIGDDTSSPYDEGFDDGIETAISCIGTEVPATDVVARDCYDRILAENDTMREMLASIGKKCGDSMADVRQVVKATWKRIDYKPCGHDYKCSSCGWKNDMETRFCPNCGADMRGDKNGQIGEKNSG